MVEGGWMGGGEPRSRGTSRGATSPQVWVPWLQSVPLLSATTLTRRSWPGWPRRWAGQRQARGWRGGPGPARQAEFSAHPLTFQGSEVNAIGIGTSVVTYPRQPSLGCVYKVGRSASGLGGRPGSGKEGPASPAPCPHSWCLWEASHGLADGGPREADIAWEQDCLPAPGL